MRKKMITRKNKLFFVMHIKGKYQINFTFFIVNILLQIDGHIYKALTSELFLQTLRLKINRGLVIRAMIYFFDECFFDHLRKLFALSSGHRIIALNFQAGVANK